MVAKRTSKKTASKVRNSIITCPPSMDISQVQELQEKFKQLINKGKPVVIDGSEIERVDTACLQLLCNFILQARVAKMAVDWRDPSASLQESASLLGLIDHLNLSL